MFQRKEKELETYLNSKMSGHDFSVTGNLNKTFEINCTGLKSQTHIISYLVDTWLHKNGYAPVPIRYTGD